MARIKFNNAGAIRIVTRSARDCIKEIMEEVLHKAQADAPVLSGDLRDAGKINYNRSSISITFDKPYAAIQHEDLSFNHPRGGKAKYLEDAFNEIVPGAIPSKAQMRIEEDLGG